MAKTREKFSSQADPALLAAMRDIAGAAGRQFQAVLEDAMRDYIERNRQDRARAHVLAALEDSIADFDDLYRELAK